MKRLILYFLIATLFYSCNTNNPEPEREPEVTDPQNYISYVSGNTSTQITSLSKYTVIKLKFKYHINDNEISSKGFQVSQIVCTDLNDMYKRISHKFELTLRTDTIEYNTNLWEYASPGDTAFFIVNLQRRLSEDTYYPLVSDTLMFKVIE